MKLSTQWYTNTMALYPKLINLKVNQKLSSNLYLKYHPNSRTFHLVYHWEGSFVRQTFLYFPLNIFLINLPFLFPLPPLVAPCPRALPQL